MPFLNCCWLTLPSKFARAALHQKSLIKYERLKEVCRCVGLEGRQEALKAIQTLKKQKIRNLSADEWIFKMCYICYSHNGIYSAIKGMKYQYMLQPCRTLLYQVSGVATGQKVDHTATELFLESGYSSSGHRD